MPFQCQHMDSDMVHWVSFIKSEVLMVTECTEVFFGSQTCSSRIKWMSIGLAVSVIWDWCLSSFWQMMNAVNSKEVSPINMNETAVEVFDLLLYCAVWVVGLLLTFWDSMLVPSLRVRMSKKDARTGGCVNMQRHWLTGRVRGASHGTVRRCTMYLPTWTGLSGRQWNWSSIPFRWRGRMAWH
jgi:hypothetical protein